MAAQVTKPPLYR